MASLNAALEHAAVNEQGQRQANGETYIVTVEGGAGDEVYTLKNWGGAVFFRGDYQAFWNRLDLLNVQTVSGWNYTLGRPQPAPTVLTGCSKCHKDFPQAQARYTGLGINSVPRCYCPNCYRKVEWARAHPGYNRPRLGATARREARASAEERANNRYWERVDNYRELGYDPN